MGAGTVIDAASHLQWPSEKVIWDRLDPEWRDYVGTAGSLPGGWGARPIHIENPYTAPGVTRGVGAASEDDPDEGLTRVLVQEAGVLLGAEPNPYLAREVMRAANDWLLEERLRPGAAARRGAIVVAPQLPEAAAAEIDRRAADPLFAAVQLGATAFARPFGHPVHLPVIEAAHRHRLPLIIHADGDAALETPATPNGAGPTATYAELQVLAAQALMSQLVSFISHGTFERMPELKVLLHGGAAGWLGPLLWRLDTNFKGLRREMPWAKRMPSEYVRDHIRVTTCPLDDPAHPERVQAMLATEPALAGVLCFAGGPRGCPIAPADAEACLPEEWRSGVMHDTAADLFGDRIPT